MNKKDYMRLPKERLAELLEQRDTLDMLLKKSYPIHTGVPVDITAPTCFHGGPCTNPQMDCVNCPGRGITGIFTTNTLADETRDS